MAKPTEVAGSPEAVIAELRARLEEAEETLGAIRRGEVDALVVESSRGPRVFTLDSAERPYRLFVEQMLQGTATLSRDGVVLYANRQLAAMLERTEPQLVGSSFLDHVAGRDRAALAPVLASGDRGPGVRLDLGLRAVSGREFPTRLAVTSLTGDAGAACAIVVTDLSEERRHHELAVAAATMERHIVQYRAFFEAVPGLAWSADPDGTPTYVSAQWEAYTGMSLEEVKQRGWGSLSHPEDAERLLETWTAARQAGQTLESEFRYRRYDGAYEWFLGRTVPVRNSQGEIAEWVGVLVNIQGHKEFEEALRRSEEQFRALVAGSPDVIARFDPALRCLYISPAVATYMGGQLPALPDLTLAQMGVPAELAAQGNAKLVHVFTTGRETSLEFDVETRIGRRRFWSRLSPLFDARGKVDSVMAITGDITDRHGAEAALRRTLEDLARSNRDLEQFAAVVAHDFRQPLATLVNYAGVLRMTIGNQVDEKSAHYLDRIVDRATRMGDLLAAVLNYSRIGGQELQKDSIDLEDVADGIIADLTPRARAIGAVLERRPLPVVVADPVLIRQVLQNLIENALKFHGSARPRVRIGSTVRQGTATIFVADNGIGIAPAHCEKIFTIFQRLHREEEYPGMGVGLAMCRKIVELHGGRIWVKSELGKGTTFYFTLRGRRRRRPSRHDGP